MSSTTTALSPTARAEAIARMEAEELDILVIGGGVVGAGTALDAVTRGLKVGLLEARDYAAGTSSRSSKLFHGGLRYLEQFNFSLVFEALKERSLVLNTLCPHLARPVPFIYPLEKVIDRPYVGLGIGVYDVMGAGRGVPSHHKHLGKKKTLESFPSGKRSAIRGAVKFYEGQVDDARHTMMIARTAAAYGALCANSTRVTGFLREDDKVVGVLASDLETGRSFEVRAKQVINAAGVWTDEVQQMVGGRGQFQVRASKGVHLVVPRNRINSATGIITRTEKSLLFVIPWGSHWIIGTTDTDWKLDLAHPAASQSDIDYILGHVNKLLADPLDRADVVGVYAGLRPLLFGESDSTSTLSREHAVSSPVRGLTVIAGGKYTTYRVMAKDAVDAAVHGLERTVPKCVTENIPLVGADGYLGAYNSRNLTAERTGMRVSRVEHLLGRYGTLMGEVLDLIDADPELGKPLDSAPEYLKAEVVYAASHEGAQHLEDILTRRTRISIEVPDRGEAAAEEVARLVAPILGWDDQHRAEEIEHYRLRVLAERDSQQQPDDETADAARLGAPDVRAGVS
ncbi:MAG: glycerol-3-phosphate dehydrogenase/oxidase [Rhodococcus sp.]|jgi:glycerol-3-phosphate dehydrogenase|uniref:glycerol-3-phosphate dehydrogenase/oxidase n=1 Tax=Nocardiaceae TaxID=85025 RepID=UPI00050C1A74|nr:MULTISPECIES: glycerol-3-phosphate dehydrogenase/oxidase [Rhodococcus]MBW4779383.1 glycerol-3-phosphate dehydrogenase/oxidase [Rhodococcus fascians]MCX6491129.1 glycerol-3-phosphate dehydrogenase/oxidase [Rhodococcus sp. (in: high G+C Gram-positive bacteria)]MDJ0001932.1 glycerol-3-phosphate dehydrogenase/oxidase [Rhodococcus fascians]MDJ0425575.1 glycerol-3-phosphate dehydrogenase/oxidase [Rhodococcus fascians]WQH28906.1 glycerol-3-phosphate dehydrogenase/oxidase [Rhodococcus fascians]